MGVHSIKNLAKNVFEFYVQGFRSMTLGRTLWKIIAIKLLIIFFVFKFFFFPDILKKHFNTDEQRAEHVMEVLTLEAKAPLGHKKNSLTRGGHL